MVSRLVLAFHRDLGPITFHLLPPTYSNLVSIAIQWPIIGAANLYSCRFWLPPCRERALTLRRFLKKKVLLSPVMSSAGLGLLMSKLSKLSTHLCFHQQTLSYTFRHLFNHRT
jgi:hypothetical protein